MRCGNENDRQQTTCHDIREIMDLQVEPRPADPNNNQNTGYGGNTGPNRRQ